jgi:hypothetical protein
VCCLIGGCVRARLLAVTTTQVKGGVVEGSNGGPQLANDNDKHRDNAARTLRNVDVSVCYLVVPAHSMRAAQIPLLPACGIDFILLCRADCAAH